MLEFAYPWLFALAVVPLIVRRVFHPYREKQPSVQVPFFELLVEFTGASPGKGAVVRQKMRMQKIALAAGWCLLVVAMARPQWIGEPVETNRSARDIMIAVDISGSMGERDFKTPEGQPITRLEGVNRVMKDFVDRRPLDRLGMIVFGTFSYLQTPFTDDHPTFLSLLREAQVGMAGPKTNFGDAMGLAVRLFEKSKTRNRVLIVLTDGNDTGSKVPPVEAAKIALAGDIRIYAVAMGDPAAAGQEKIDVETLRRIAAITGGRFFEAQNHGELEKAHQDIMALEPEEYETIVYSPRKSLHPYFLGAIIILYSVFFTTFFVLAMTRKARAADDI